MTINEFLEIVSLAFNGVYGEDKSTFKALELASIIIDLSPEVDNTSCAGYKKKKKKDGNIIAERFIELKDGTQFVAKRETPLSDDINLHLKKFENVEQAVNFFVDVLKSSNESNKRIEAVTGEKQLDYGPVITKLYECLSIKRKK